MDNNLPSILAKILKGEELSLEEIGALSRGRAFKPRSPRIGEIFLKLVQGDS